MPDSATLVIDTDPLIALAAGLGELSVLTELYSQVLVPAEVCAEIASLRSSQFVQTPFDSARWITRGPSPANAAPWLVATLDDGEAAVIQLALDQQISTVCIDEAAGRRVATLCGLQLTDSVGILLRAKREGKIGSVRKAIDSMRAKGVWLSDRLIAAALTQAGE